MCESQHIRTESKSRMIKKNGIDNCELERWLSD